MFEKICTKYTVTTVLVLPIIDRYIDIFLHREKSAVFPFTLLASNHGFINAYLDIDQEKSMDSSKPGTDIYLLFKAPEVLDVMDPAVDTTYYSFNEMVTSCPLFWKVYHTGEDYIIYHLILPDEWLEDIKIIKSGKYSEVSDKYKKDVILREASIPISDNKTIIYLMSKNFAYQALNKTEFIQDEIFKSLGTSPGDSECFKMFDKAKETLNTEDLLIPTI